MNKKQFRPWTKAEIAALKNYGPFLNKYALTSKLPMRTPIAIGAKCKRLGIKKSKLFKSEQGKLARAKVRDSYKKLDWELQFSDLSYETRQILIGSILGDGFVTLNASKSQEHCFRESHGPAQNDYLKWKTSMLKELDAKFNLTKKGSNLLTPTHPIFSQMRQEFYFENTHKCNLINSFVREIDWLGFLIWYLDDGCLQSRKRTITISAKLFNPDQIQHIVTILNIKLGLKLTINVHKHRDGLNSRINVTVNDRDTVHKKFSELFDAYNIPNCMRYKIGLKPSTYKIR